MAKNAPGHIDPNMTNIHGHAVAGPGQMSSWPSGQPGSRQPDLWQLPVFGRLPKAAMAGPAKTADALLSTVAVLAATLAAVPVAMSWQV